MFSENIINLTFFIIIKLTAFRVDKFSAGRTKCRSPMLKRTWWNSLALFLIVNLKGVLKPYLGLVINLILEQSWSILRAVISNTKWGSSSLDVTKILINLL